MLEDFIASKFGFWVVAWIMTLADSAFLLEPGKFVFTVPRSLRPNLKTSAVPFTISNKELIFALYSAPFCFFFVSSISAPCRRAQHTFKALSVNARRQRRAQPLLVIAFLAMLALVSGPVISAVWGVQYSIVLLLPFLYVSGIAASAVIWTRRKSFGLSNGTVLKMSTELILCPVCVINVFKRISLVQSWQLNTLSVAKFCSSPKDALSAINENMKFYGERVHGVGLD
jgi:hypothetical protein